MFEIGGLRSLPSKPHRQYCFCLGPPSIRPLGQGFPPLGISLPGSRSGARRRSKGRWLSGGPPTVEGGGCGGGGRAGVRRQDGKREGGVGITRSMKGISQVLFFLWFGFSSSKTFLCHMTGGKKKYRGQVLVTSGYLETGLMAATC